jgi:hypothetical protein
MDCRVPAALRRLFPLRNLTAPGSVVDGSRGWRGIQGGDRMAVNKPTGDNARKGAVKKRTQLKTNLGGATAFTKRSKASGEFMAIKSAKGKKAAKKFKGVRVEKAGKKAKKKKAKR